jgi:exopolysaccharide biosynthesis polyprenyl glycosylphosphotransferase
MRSFKLHKIFLLAVLVSDAAVVAGSFFLAWWLRFGSGLLAFEPPAPPLNAYLKIPVLSVLAYLLVFNYLGLYQRRWAVVGSGDPSKIFRGVAVATALVFAFGFLYRSFSYSRLVLGLMAALNVLLLVFVRRTLNLFQLYLRRRGVGVLRVAVLGEGAEARGIAESLRRHPGYGFRLVGFVGKKEQALLPNLGPTAKLEEILEKSGVDAVVMAPSRSLGPAEIASLAVRVVRADAQCMMLADVLGMMANRLRLEELFGMPVLTISPPPLGHWRNRLMKRAMDITLTLAGIVVLSPLLVLLAVLVKLSSPGPVFYRQERVGRGGRVFMMMKFRSMRADAEKATGAVWAVKDDPRRTSIGAFLRRTSLDELPQLFNILKGDMSIVGPRPERQHFVDKFVKEVPRYAERHQVQPGLSGWAAVNGLRGNTPVGERTKYDIFYIENWSLWLDTKIIIRTALEVFHHREAY